MAFIAETFRKAPDIGLLRIGKYGWLPLNIPKTKSTLGDVSFSFGTDVTPSYDSEGSKPISNTNANYVLNIEFMLDITGELELSYFLSLQQLVKYITKNNGELNRQQVDKKNEQGGILGSIQSATKFLVGEITQQQAACEFYSKKFVLTKGFLESLTLDPTDAPDVYVCSVVIKYSVDSLVGVSSKIYGG